MSLSTGKAVTVLLVAEQCEKFSVQGGQVCLGCDWSGLCSLVKVIVNVLSSQLHVICC